ncbi:MAG: hypothetical protein CME39_08125 [Haliea sp.]|nr:hypothetical protein [Haliea sp.]|tara:strand:+ start:160 stop:1074 length:915 start_codon:yes stop_codon:yes gene_type:complete
MDRNSSYYRQVQFLIQLLPLVAGESCFALKGGTAINLFVRDFPRLSVDIDLVYLPSGGREEALEAIKAALERLAEEIEKTFPGVTVVRSYRDKQDALRLTVANKGASIKIELSPVLRGTVFAPQIRSVVPAVEDEFGFAELAVVSFEDLFAGKICAALDRQHPRDWFDIHLLLENEGLTEPLIKTFLVYLISHSRPMEDLLAPNFKTLNTAYGSEFVGMTQIDVAVKTLEETRVRLINQIAGALSHEDKAFLCSMYELLPNWSLLGLEGIQDLPAVQWNLHNIRKMTDERRKASLERLRQVLSL